MDKKLIFIFVLLSVSFGSLFLLESTPQTGQTILSNNLSPVTVFIIFIIGSSFLILVSIVSENIAEELNAGKLKKGTTEYSLPEVDISVTYSDKISSGVRLPGYDTQTKKPYVWIMLPTREGVRNGILDRYKRMNESKPEDEYEVRRLHREATMLAEMYQKFDVAIYGVAKHEIGHVEADLLKLPKGIAEGIAEAYGFRGVLAAAREGKFSEEEALDHIDHAIRIYKDDPETDAHRIGFESVLEGFDPHSKDIEGLIAELDERIEYSVNKGKEGLKE